MGTLELSRIAAGGDRIVVGHGRHVAPRARIIKARANRPGTSLAPDRAQGQAVTAISGTSAFLSPSLVTLQWVTSWRP
jgi:hypothetical protein